MLTAKYKNKKIFASETKERKNYTCPYCNNILRLVKPETGIVDHFRHKTKSDCSPEPETREHHAGKQYLYDKLKEKYNTVILEPTDFLKYGFKPDIFLIIDNFKVVIEFQCSPITRKEIIARTRSYTKYGMYTCWILGINKFDAAYGIDEVRSVRDMEKQLHQMYYGWVYYLSNSDLGSNLFCQKLGTFSRIKYANEYAINHFGATDYEYFYKTKKIIKQQCFINNLDFELNFNRWNNSFFNIASFAKSSFVKDESGMDAWL